MLKLADEIEAAREEYFGVFGDPIQQAEAAHKLKQLMWDDKFTIITALRQAASLGREGGERNEARSASAWQTVPLPATPEMTAAGERIDAEMRAQGFANAEPEAIYYAMLDAAPQPPALSPPVKTGGEAETVAQAAPEPCKCGIMCQDHGEEGGCRYKQPARETLRKLVDIVYQHATEGETFPATHTADLLIDRAFGVGSSVPSAHRNSEAGK